jgi:methionyl-tRNA synthetase
MKSKRFITTTIPYVNASPHIGFGMELIQADVTARYWREKLGEEFVYALRGSDENSLKNVLAAEAAGKNTETFVEEHAEEFKALQESLGTSFDQFIRTRDKKHMEGAQKLWKACNPSDIYKKTYSGMYCVGCEMFYTEKEVVNGICPDHQKPLELVEEENYFFRLSEYQQQLDELISSDTIRITPESRKNEMLSFIRSGLEDFSISRSQERARHWGVPVPGDESQVMYVWFDALSNYITALGYIDSDEYGGEDYRKFWEDEDIDRVQVLGKGVVRFHAIYWPAMLLSAKLPLPTELFVHGYITVEGQKMSKSIGNVIHPKTLVEEYGTDAVRYFFLREIPSYVDGDYSKDRMEERYAELANQLGNLVSRVAAMSEKYFDGVLDAFEKDWGSVDAEIQSQIHAYNFKAYCDKVFEIVREANEITDKRAPFKLVNEDEAAAKLVLSELAEMIRWASRALAPIMPEASAEILRRYSGEKILTGDPLFPRRDQ